MQVSTENIIKLIVFITLVLVALAFFISGYVRLYNQRKKKEREERDRMKDEFERQLLRSQIEVQEATNAELARELHDNVGQLLGTASMLFGITERKMGTVPDTFLTAQETLSKAITELRGLSRSLDKEWLARFDCISNIKTVANRINTSGEIAISFSHPDKLFLDADKQVILFRVVQEALQNSLKHSGAKTIDIAIKENNQQLQVQLCDNGKGMQEDAENGLGLRNMKQRTDLLGGHVEWKRHQEGGTAVLITIPLNNHV